MPEAIPQTPMPFWPHIIVQARDLLNNLRPVQRMTLLAVPLLVATCLALFAVDRSDSHADVLIDGQPLAENDLDAARAILNQAGLRNHRVEDRRLLVPRKELSRYAAALRSLGGGDDRRQPKRDQGRESGLSFLLSDHERQALADEARARELECEIRKHPDIDSARLFVDRGRIGSWGRANRMTASLMLVPRDGTTLPDELLDELRSIVAHSYSGLAAENVVVSRQQPQSQTRHQPTPPQQPEQSPVSSEIASRTSGTGSPRLRSEWSFARQLPAFLRTSRSKQLAIACVVPLGTALACACLLLRLHRRNRRRQNAAVAGAANSATESPKSIAAGNLDSAAGDPRVAMSRIQQLVRNDPEATVGIITGWIAAET